MVRTLDTRETDVELPILIALRLQSGAWDGNTIRGQAPSVACTIQLIAIDVEQAKNALSDPVTTESANEATKGWVRQAVEISGCFPNHMNDRFMRSVQALLMNQKRRGCSLTHLILSLSWRLPDAFSVDPVFTCWRWRKWTIACAATP